MAEIDTSTVTLDPNGPPSDSFYLSDYVIISGGLTHKLFFVFDATDSLSTILSGSAVTMENDSLFFTASYSSPYLQIGDFLDVTAACNGDDGEIDVNLLQFDFEGIVDVAWLQFGSELVVFDPPMTELNAGTYTLMVLDSICSYLVNIDIPDGSFTIDLDVLAPYYSCISDSLDTTGSLPAEVEGLITGGFGFYNHSLASNPSVEWFSDSLVQVQGVLAPGNYLLQSVDTLSGCAVNTPFTVPDSTIVFELELVDIVPIATNGLGSFYLDYGVITVEPNLSGYTVNYSWSPGPGNDNIPGTYSELEDPVVYTVIATINGTDCTTTLEVDMTDFICLFSGDFNGDGVINSSDLAIIMSHFGTSCPSAPGCQGDLNYDGLINMSDITIFLTNYGAFVDDICGP